MKEQYTTPELNVVCFAPVERLANSNDLELDLLMDVSSNNGVKPSAGVDDGDFGLELL